MLRSPMFPVVYAIFMDPAPRVRHAFLSREYCSASWEELVEAGIFQQKRRKHYAFDPHLRVFAWQLIEAICWMEQHGIVHCSVREDHILVQMTSAPSADFNGLQQSDQVKLIGLEYSRKATDYRQALKKVSVFEKARPLEKYFAISGKARWSR
ncbi:hypothetical protein AAVH_14469 [Aphelenchoides avenae]|nr:hypothetical protein AAVH_14469 [Aphelenchus avenae]